MLSSVVNVINLEFVVVRMSASILRSCFWNAYCHR